MTMYNATVIVTLSFPIDGASRDDANQAARRVACGRPRILPQDVHDVVLIEATVAERLRADNLKTWQELEALKLGTGSQLDRWSAGKLPDEELRELARAELFAPLAVFPRWEKLVVSDLPHPSIPREGIPCLHKPDVGFSTIENPTISPGQWETLATMRVVAEEIGRHPWLADGPDDAVRLFVREHRGVCRRCRREASRHSVSVQIQWAQRTLTREFAL